MFDWLFPGINRKLDQIMATLEGLTTAVHNNTTATDALTAVVNAAVDELHRLGDIVRAGDPISQADLDNLANELSGATAEADAASVALQSAVDEDETPPA